MPSSWFLILLLRCIDFLSWPVLALGYPLCASIEAIESESHSETRNLISYWILLSLIYLFEYAFLNLLQRFQYWHYMKLMMVAFLVMPNFGRSAYVYNQLIRSCMYMNPQAVISRFKSRKNIFSKNEDLFMQAEKCITQNGTETFEKLLASKKTEQSIHAETRKAVPTTTEKNEILKTNRGRLLMEQKDIKELEMIEKEVPEGKIANTALDSLKSNESSSSAIKTAADTEHGTYAHISASENVQKEWTCAICQLTMPSEANLNSHLQGKKHKSACEALNTKTKATVETDIGNEASPQVSTSKNAQKIWTCEICQLTMYESNLNSHLQGKKHKSSCEALNTKTKATVGTDIGNEASPQVSTSKNAQKIWTCEICQLTMYESNLNSHLQGKKHKSACEALNTKTKATVGTDIGNEASPQVSMSKNAQKIWTCDICQLTMHESNLNTHLRGKKHKAASEALNMKTKGTAGTDTGNGASLHISPSTNVRKFLTCYICQLTMLEVNMSSHLQGKKHKATREALKVKSQHVA